MSAPRRRKFFAAIRVIGAAVADPTEALDGWPGRLTITTSSGPVEIALHVSGISTHSRRSYERRFQNPAQDDRPPVSDFHGAALPILLGLDDERDPGVFVAINGTSRLGNANRFSLLFHEEIIREAKATGWAEYESSTGEQIYAFIPPLFPAFIEQLAGGEMLRPGIIHEAAIAAGLLDETDNTQAAIRATRAVNILVRKAGAGRKIRAAYGFRCAMCGLGSNFLVGAHIFPVEAPGSTDNVWNGLSLCQNHHAAFDQHLIWIDPRTKAIRLHRNLYDEAAHNSGARHFVESTFPVLANANTASNSPRKNMFTKRYDHFPNKYDWVA
jgi:hypothetical protein